MFVEILTYRLQFKYKRNKIEQNKQIADLGYIKDKPNEFTLVIPKK